LASPIFKKILKKRRNQWENYWTRGEGKGLSRVSVESVRNGSLKLQKGGVMEKRVIELHGHELSTQKKGVHSGGIGGT